MSAARAAFGFLRIKSRVSFATRFNTPASAASGAANFWLAAANPKIPVIGKFAPIPSAIARAYLSSEFFGPVSPLLKILVKVCTFFSSYPSALPIWRTAASGRENKAALKP